MGQGLDLNATVHSDTSPLLDLLTSATVVLGDAGTVRGIAAATARRQISLGAQITPVSDPLYQLGALDAVARAAGTRIGFVRTGDPDITDELIAAVLDYDRSIQVVVRPGTALLTRAYRAGLITVREGPGVPYPRTLRLPSDPETARTVRDGLLSFGVRLAAFTGSGTARFTPEWSAATDKVVPIH